MCGEGGCGCCVVSVTRKDPATEKDSTIAINSVRLKCNSAVCRFLLPADFSVIIYSAINC